MSNAARHFIIGYAPFYANHKGSGYLVGYEPLDVRPGTENPRLFCSDEIYRKALPAARKRPGLLVFETTIPASAKEIPAVISVHRAAFPRQFELTDIRIDRVMPSAMGVVGQEHREPSILMHARLMQFPVSLVIKKTIFNAWALQNLPDQRDGAYALQKIAISLPAPPCFKVSATNRLMAYQNRELGNGSANQFIGGVRLPDDAKIDVLQLLPHDRTVRAAKGLQFTRSKFVPL